jgi:hypothetical protein
MFIVNRIIVLSFVTVALAAGPLGCSAPSDANDDAVASGTSDLSATNTGLLTTQEARPSLSPLADNHGGPTLDQIVAILTRALDLTEIQVKALRAFLQAQEDAYRHTHH